MNINATELINWQTFKTHLLQNPESILQFQYNGNQWVDASYHITEIKQAPIVSVDCGGEMNSWTEIIIQLWEPQQKDSERAMKVSKALSIIQLVENVLPLNPLGTVKIEFGNSQFDTRQMYLTELMIDGEDMIVNLSPDITQCKAIGRGQSCGTNDKGEECCAPVDVVKPKILLKNLSANEQLCTPGSGCC